MPYQKRITYSVVSKKLYIYIYIVYLIEDDMLLMSYPFRYVFQIPWFIWHTRQSNPLLVFPLIDPAFEALLKHIFKIWIKTHIKSMAANRKPMAPVTLTKTNNPSPLRFQGTYLTENNDFLLTAVTLAGKNNSSPLRFLYNALPVFRHRLYISINI